MKYLPVLFFLLISTLSVLGQVAPQTEKVGPITQASQQNQELWKKQQDSMVNEGEKKLRQLSENTEGDFPTPGTIYLPEPRLTKEQKQLVTLTKDDLQNHADFLKLPKTGIMRLFPNLCGDSRVLDIRNEKCSSNNISSISFYSFRRKVYDFQDWTDLRYQDNKFAVGLKNLTIGLIAETDTSEIESLSSDSPQVKSLLEFQMPKKLDEIRVKKEQIENGMEIGNLKFFDQAKVSINQTYLLRSHAYRTRESAANDRRIDLIVVFQVVRVDENEGLTIIWRELYKGNSHPI